MDQSWFELAHIVHERFYAYKNQSSLAEVDRLFGDESADLPIDFNLIHRVSPVIEVQDISEDYILVTDSQDLAPICESAGINLSMVGCAFVNADDPDNEDIYLVWYPIPHNKDHAYRIAEYKDMFCD